MSEQKKTELVPTRVARDPFALMRQMTSEFDRVLSDWPAFRFPTLGAMKADGLWAPKTDVFERDGRLVTRVDLPGMKKEDILIEATDGHLTLSGERKSDVEEKKDGVYRREREYGSFSRMVPLPEGVKLDDIKATFADGVLEVSVPLPAQPAKNSRKVQIEDAKAKSKSAA